MARGSFLRNLGVEEAGSQAPEAAAGGPLTAFIDQGSTFEGKLSFQDTVRIDGRFRGEISSENTLIVGESGEIEATVRSRNVIISGRVTGDVFASNQLVLHKTGKLEGDVETGSLLVEQGAILNGRVTTKASEASARGPAKLAPAASASTPNDDE